MNINRQMLIALAAVAGALSLQPLTCGADTNSVAPAAGGLGSMRERMQETARELNLTEEQKQKLQAIIRERLEKLRDLRQDTSLTQEEKMAKFRAARDEITAEVKNVLSPDQYEKWKTKQGQLLGGAGAIGATGAASSRPIARMQEAIKELNLTEAQKTQLKPLYEEQMEKLRGLRQDTSLSMAEKLEKLKSVQEEIAPKLKKVLDADQFAKWEKDARQWMQEIKRRFEEQK